MSLELSLFNSLHDLVGKSGLLDWLFIFLANYFGYFLVAGFIFLLLKERNRHQRLHYLFFGLLTTILSRGLITEIIRFFYDRPRPFDFLSFTPLISHDPGNSLPSGHAAFYFALALTVFIVNKKWWGWIFLASALLIGLARIIAGVHWPSDILAGLAVSIVSFFVVKYLLSSFRK